MKDTTMIRLASLAAAAMMVASPLQAAAPTAPVQDPMSYDNYLTCAAMFFVTANYTSDAELKEALEAGVGVMLNRAQALPSAANISEDELLNAAVEKAIALDDRVSSMSATDREAAINSTGPGMVPCLDEVLTER